MTDQTTDHAEVDEPLFVDHDPDASAADTASGTTDATPAPGDTPSADVDGEDRPPADDEQTSADATADEPEPIDWESLAAEDGRTAGQLLEALTAVESERDERLDQLRRKQAEFDNFRKRRAREAQLQRTAGMEAVATSLLEVIDDFDRTLAALASDEASRKGVELVRDKLVAALGAHGVQPIDAQDQPFDPNLHEAVSQVPGDGDEPVVAEVYRTGWRMHDKVLRAAMVVVAQ